MYACMSYSYTSHFQICPCNNLQLRILRIQFLFSIQTSQIKVKQEKGEMSVTRPTITAVINYLFLIGVG